MEETRTPPPGPVRRLCANGSRWLLLAFLVAGCSTVDVSRNDAFRGVGDAEIVLMPPDIQYFRVTASGIPEPNADWTEAARMQFHETVADFTTWSGVRVVEQDNAERTDLAVEYDRLHAAVGRSILVHHYGPLPLPAHRGAFDWSLGSGVRHAMRTAPGRRYALFVHYRDYEASGGRIAMAVFAAALGASIYTGHQSGFASLVDLESGDVVWFNHVPVSDGDLRSPRGARRIVEQLFSELGPSA